MANCGMVGYNVTTTPAMLLKTLNFDQGSLPKVHCASRGGATAPRVLLAAYDIPVTDSLDLRQSVYTAVVYA